MYYLFALIYVVCILYILLKKRSIDLFTILFGGLFYYSFPLLIGKIVLPGVVLNQKINYMVYFVYVLVFIISFFFMLKNDVKKKESVQYKIREYADKFTSKNLNIVVFVILGIFLIGIFQFGFSNYMFTNKSVNEEKISLIETSVVLSMIMLPVCLYYRKKMIFSICFLILFSFLLYGSRSYFVVAILSSIFILFRFKELRLIAKLHWIILLLFFATIMAIFKYLYSSFKLASLDRILSIVESLDFSNIMLQLLADPMAVVYNLNYTINNNLDLPIGYLFHRFFSIVPGGGNVFSIITDEAYPRYSAILANNYTDVHWGLASSLYGELIAISGFIGFILVYIFMNKLVMSFNNKIRLYGLTIYNLLFISSFTYMLFYSHRLDITFVLGIFKNSIMLWIFLKYILRIRFSN